MSVLQITGAPLCISGDGGVTSVRTLRTFVHGSQKKGGGDNLELIRLQGRGGGGGGGRGMVGAAAHNKTFKTEWDLVSKRTVSIETVAMTGRKSHLIRNKKI